MDHLVGYDPSEPADSPYAIGNTSIIDEIEEISFDKAMRVINEQTTEFLGNKVTCHSLPIRPGRNLAVIVETAAVNHRQKKMGYNAAHELYRRVQENIMNKRGDI